jgi:hypothetical protein
VNLNAALSPSFAPRPKYHASHGSTVEMHGTPAASQASATGLTTSGVDEASIMSIWSELIRPLATSAARWGLDWLSRGTIWILYVLPSPPLTPFAVAFLTRSMM